MKKQKDLEKTAPVPRKDPTCQVCGESLRERAVVLCKKCKTAHHLECWRFNKGCSMYGCGSRISQKPPTELELSGQGPFTIDAGRVRRSQTSAKELMSFLIPFLLLTFLCIFTPSAAVIGLNVLFYTVVLLLASLREISTYQLQVDPETGDIGRTTFLLGNKVSKEEHFLSANEIVELHLQREVQMTPQGTRVFHNIYALTQDSGRVPLYGKVMDPAINKGEEAEIVAEKLANFADCIVRQFDAGEEPTQKELDEAIEQKKQDLVASDQVKALPESTE